MRRIGIDCRFAAGNGGLGTYTRSIVGALLSREDDVCFVLFVRSHSEEWLSALPKKSTIKICEAPFRHYSFSEQIFFPLLIRREACDLFYAPHFNVPIFCPVPFFVTVHDLILHRHPNETGLLRRLAYRFVLWQALKRSKGIVAVSDYTGKDIAITYPSIAGKITRSYPGVGAHFQKDTGEGIQALRKKYSLLNPFLLYVGNCKQHKNVPILIDAFQRAHLQNIDLVLICGGRECESLSLPERVKKIEGVRSEDFPALYSAALALVTATKDEGFGLPMAEAMACGCPVLATSCGAIPEVCGDHALLVEPTVEALAAGMQRITSDPHLRTSSRLSAAKEWVKRYDWNSAAAIISTLFLR